MSVLNNTIYLLCRTTKMRGMTLAFPKLLTGGTKGIKINLNVEKRANSFVISETFSWLTI